ncbi:MAG TPA: FG-GAP repeat protein [Thermoanaerobaculia bacterium]
MRVLRASTAFFASLLALGLAREAVAIQQFLPQARLTASDAAAGDSFGSQVALSSDGMTALVGAPGDDCAVSPDCGAAYVFVLDHGAWIQQAKLSIPNAAPGDRIAGMALSADGDTVLIGAAHTDCSAGVDCGAAYVFARDGTVWTFQQKLTASDARANDYFGSQVALSGDGDIALVGAFKADCGSFPFCGAVYAFTRSGGVWTEQQKLTGEPSPGSSFGSSLALSEDGDTALVLGDYADIAFPGRVYVFVRSGGVWSLQEKLSSPYGSGSRFAADMDLSADGDIALVEATDFFPGANYGLSVVVVFSRTGATWSRQTLLYGFHAGDNFGSSLDLSSDGQTAIIGTQFRGCAPGFCGPAYIFSRNGGAWDLAQELTAPGEGRNYSLGPVALSGDGRTAFLGVPDVPCVSGPACGAVYAFTNAPLAVGIPTVSEVGLALLALALAVYGASCLRRSRPRSA